MDAELERLYSTTGRPSIAPERLLGASLLMVLYSIRSERQLMEQLGYNLLYRWFVGLEMDGAVWDVTVFTKNRGRLIVGGTSQRLLESVLEEAREHDLLSEEHLTVDGMLLEAWVSLNSFRPKGEKAEGAPDDPGNPTVDFQGERRSNEAHESNTDPDARLARKGRGKEAKLSYSGNLQVENRHGLIVNAELLEASGRAERDWRRGVMHDALNRLSHPA